MPTIGYNVIGATAQATTSALNPQGYTTTSGLTYTAASGDVVTQVAAYGSDTGTCQIGIYTVSSGIPVARVGSAVTINIGASLGWHTASCSIALTAGIEYTVCFDYSFDADWTWYRNGSGVGGNPGGNQVSSDTSSGFALPATWTHASYGAGRHSFYATVTSGGGGAVPIFLGTTAITDIKLGTTDIAKTYLGTTQIWP